MRLWQYLKQHSCLWPVWTCNESAYTMALTPLQYRSHMLRNRGCPPMSQIWNQDRQLSVQTFPIIHWRRKIRQMCSFSQCQSHMVLQDWSSNKLFIWNFLGLLLNLKFTFSMFTLNWVSSIWAKFTFCIFVYNTPFACLPINSQYWKHSSSPHISREYVPRP